MNLDRLFNLISYTVVFCGFLTLAVAGSFGMFITVLFPAAMVVAWFLEGSRWQLSERVGTALIFITIPLFYVGWKYRIFEFSGSDTVIAGLLARLILGLSVLKLFQKKADRDWLFLYLMAFFEILLAAALSISPLYVASLALYLFVTVMAIIGLDIRKSARLVNPNQEKPPAGNHVRVDRASFKRLPSTAIALLFFISAFALPLFFMLPRVGGAGFGANQTGLSGMTGFSERVTLGDIGRIQQSDEVVMRVRVEGGENLLSSGLRWRGVALDTFDNKVWSKDRRPGQNVLVKNENDAFLIEYASGKRALTNQTFYVEPMDTDVLFALPRPIVVIGSFPTISRDAYGVLTASRSNSERATYKVVSDRWTPEPDALRKDNNEYAANINGYFQLPENLDPRIRELAANVTRGKTNRFDRARAIEEFLQNEFGYTLEQKASGDQPVADFLFNIREGHCEYFATAMVLMLRSQGIAARLVNGFQQGEYNSTVDMFVVKQRDAHAWVEVYFPKENSWVAFDPTPFSGQNISGGDAGTFGFVSKYLDALEAYWIQYFVSFDNQEQQSLYRSVKTGVSDYQGKLSGWLNDAQARLQNWWKDVRGDQGFQASAVAVGTGFLYFAAAAVALAAIWWSLRRIRNWSLFARIAAWLRRKRRKSAVEFYERMERVLARRGFRREPHQTPLEFAFALDMPEAVSITEKYQRVRFGEKELTDEEAEIIEGWLERVEKHNK